MKNDPAFTYEETVQVDLISFQMFRLSTSQIVIYGRNHPYLSIIIFLRERNEDLIHNISDTLWLWLHFDADFSLVLRLQFLLFNQCCKKTSRPMRLRYLNFIFSSPTNMLENLRSVDSIKWNVTLLVINQNSDMTC